MSNIPAEKVLAASRHKNVMVAAISRSYDAEEAASVAITALTVAMLEGRLSPDTSMDDLIRYAVRAVHYRISSERRSSAHRLTTARLVPYMDEDESSGGQISSEALMHHDRDLQAVDNQDWVQRVRAQLPAGSVEQQLFEALIEQSEEWVRGARTRRPTIRSAWLQLLDSGASIPKYYPKGAAKRLRKICAAATGLPLPASEETG